MRGCCLSLGARKHSMQKKWLLALWACLVCTRLVSAQTAPNSLPPPASALDVETAINTSGGRFWYQAEFLRWQVRTPVPVPIVTTGDPNDGPLAGTIGQPATRVLFGNSDVDYPHLPGMRFAMGAWLVGERTIGLEQSLMYFPTKTAVFRVASDGAGNPPIYLSGYNPVIGREDSGILADPRSQFAGSATVTTDLRLWSAELNGLFLLWGTPKMELHLLGGLRYV